MKRGVGTCTAMVYDPGVPGVCLLHVGVLVHAT